MSNPSSFVGEELLHRVDEERRLPLQQTFVFIMRSDPDPEKAIGHIDGDRAITSPAYPDRVDVVHFLEPKNSSARVLFPGSISPARRPPDWLRQTAIQFPEFIGPRRFHPSIGFYQQRARRAPGRSRHRVGRPLRPVRIPRPTARQDVREVLAPASMPPSVEVFGWLLVSRSPCSQVEVYTGEETLTKNNLAHARLRHASPSRRESAAGFKCPGRSLRDQLFPRS